MPLRVLRIWRACEVDVPEKRDICPVKPRSRRPHAELAGLSCRPWGILFKVV